MLVLNGDTVVGRAIQSLAGYADEVVYVDSGSTDRTAEAIRAVCHDLGMGCCGVTLDRNDDSMFFTDEQATWSRPVRGPFTGRRILRRWDVARNIGVDLCRGDYVFKLDADDEVVDKSGLGALLLHLDLNRSCDFVMCPYEVMDPTTEGAREIVTMQDRLWRRRPGRLFEGVIHERVSGKGLVDGRPNWTMVAQGLRVRDWRDNSGEGVRVPHRNYKVWLLEYERRVAAGEELDLHFMTSALDDAAAADPELVGSLPAATR